MTSENPTPSQEPQEPREPEEPKTSKNKLSETLDSLKKSEKIETIYSYAKSNTLDTVAYVALILGLVWMVAFDLFKGGIVVGAVFGLYFATELLRIVTDANDHIETQGMVRSLILGGTVLAFLYAAPGIFIGAAIVVGLKQIAFPASNPPPSE